jgi:hypothetical protein
LPFYAIQGELDLDKRFIDNKYARLFKVNLIESKGFSKY